MMVLGDGDSHVNIDFEKVVDTAVYRASLQSDQGDFDRFEDEARRHLSFYDWCQGIREAYVGMFSPVLLASSFSRY